MVKFNIKISIFIFLFLSFSKEILSQYYINYEHNDYCKHLYNDKLWIEKQIQYHDTHYEYYNNNYNRNYILRNDLVQHRKEISQMWHQLCNYKEDF